MKNKLDQMLKNPALLNIVTPMGLEFQRTQLTIGEFTAKVYGVSKYPPSVEMGWLSKVSHMPGTVISQLFVPVDNTLLVEAISRNIQQNRTTAESTRDPLTQKRAEKGVEDGERILTQIDQYGETVGYMTNLVMPFDNQHERFNELCRRVQGQYSVIKCKIRPLPNLQKAAFQTLSPSHVPQEVITDTLKRMMPLSTFIGGFPFSSSGYNDRTGTWFARDMQGGMVILDLWKRGGDRTNSNFVILGVSGMGKSTVIKNIVLSEYMMGTKIILIDPETEYKELSNKLHGDWINCAGGAGGRINPLQIRSVPNDDENEERSLGSLALHMKTLDIFFSLYLPGLNDIQRALLKEALVEVYQRRGIAWETDVSGLSAEDYPVMGELYEFIANKAKGQLRDYETLAAQLHDIAHGADAFLWNGPTTIQTRSQVVCLDTNDLQATSDRIKATQYFNILSWAWEQMSRDRTEKVLLVADEAYMMIDT